MNLKPEFKKLDSVTLAGMGMTMSYAENRTGLLWKNFMLRKEELKNVSGVELYSVQYYPQGFFETFAIHKPFKKWAAVPVKVTEALPDGMEHILLQKGLYAVFKYKGSSEKGPEVFRNILGTWLPGSGYELDDLPHFEILGEKYRNNHPDSEEEIWIPVKLKNP